MERKHEGVDVFALYKSKFRLTTRRDIIFAQFSVTDKFRCTYFEEKLQPQYLVNKKRDIGFLKFPWLHSNRIIAKKFYYFQNNTTTINCE